MAFLSGSAILPATIESMMENDEKMLLIRGPNGDSNVYRSTTDSDTASSPPADKLDTFIDKVVAINQRIDPDSAAARRFNCFDDGCIKARGRPHTHEIHRPHGALQHRPSGNRAGCCCDDLDVKLGDLALNPGEFLPGSHNEPPTATSSEFVGHINHTGIPAGSIEAKRDSLSSETSKERVSSTTDFISPSEVVLNATPTATNREVKEEQRSSGLHEIDPASFEENIATPACLDDMDQHLRSPSALRQRRQRTPEPQDDMEITFISQEAEFEAIRKEFNDAYAAEQKASIARKLALRNPALEHSRISAIPVPVLNLQKESVFTRYAARPLGFGPPSFGPAVGFEMSLHHLIWVPYPSDSYTKKQKTDFDALSHANKLMRLPDVWYGKLHRQAMWLLYGGLLSLALASILFINFGVANCNPACTSYNFWCTKNNGAGYGAAGFDSTTPWLHHENSNHDVSVATGTSAGISSDTPMATAVGSHISSAASQPINLASEVNVDYVVINAVYEEAVAAKSASAKADKKKRSLAAKSFGRLPRSSSGDMVGLIGHEYRLNTTSMISLATSGFNRYKAPEFGAGASIIDAPSSTFTLPSVSADQQSTLITSFLATFTTAQTTDSSIDSSSDPLSDACDAGGACTGTQSSTIASDDHATHTAATTITRTIQAPTTTQERTTPEPPSVSPTDTEETTTADGTLSLITATPTSTTSVSVSNIPTTIMTTVTAAMPTTIQAAPSSSASRVCFDDSLTNGKPVPCPDSAATFVGAQKTIVLPGAVVLALWFAM